MKYYISISLVRKSVLFDYHIVNDSTILFLISTSFVPTLAVCRPYSEIANLIQVINDKFDACIPAHKQEKVGSTIRQMHK